MATQHTNSMYFFFLFFLFHFSRFAYCTHTQCVVCIYVLFLHICQHLINFSFLLNISAFLLLFFAFALCNCALASAVTVCVCVWAMSVFVWVSARVCVCMCLIYDKMPFTFFKRRIFFCTHIRFASVCVYVCVYWMRVCMTCMCVDVCVSCMNFHILLQFITFIAVCVCFFLFLHCIFFLSFSFFKFTLRRLCWRLLSTILHAAYLVYGWYFVFFFLSVGRGTGSSKLLYAYL